MGLPGPFSESTEDIRPARGIATTASHSRSEEPSYADRDNIPGAVHSSPPSRGVAAHGKTIKSGGSDYRLEGGSISHCAGSNIGVEDGTVWEYPLPSASSSAAVRSDVESNLFRSQKGASVAGKPTSIIVGFESQTSTSSHITTSKHSSDKADALQVSHICGACA